MDFDYFIRECDEKLSNHFTFHVDCIILTRALHGSVFFSAYVSTTADVITVVT
jgi:hypothetical protein